MEIQLSDLETSLLDEIKQAGSHGVTRAMLDTNERKVARKLVKAGLVTRGTSEDKQASVCYFIN